MQQRTTTVSQRSLCRSKKRQDKQSPADKEGRRARLSPSACREGAYDFLSTIFEDKPLLNIEKDGNILNIKKVYKTFREKCKLFFSGTDIEIPDYKKGSLPLKMASLTSWFESTVENMGFFAEVRSSGTNLAYMNVLFHSSHLCDNIIIFYAKPLDILPKEAAQLYREFLAYVYKYMNVSMGTERHNDIPNLEYIMDWFVEMGNDDKDTERRKELAKNYALEGRYEKEFDRISKINVDPDELRYKLMVYDNEDDISKVLISHLYEGFDLIPEMNLQMWGYDETEETAEDDEYYDGFGCIIPHWTTILWADDGVPGCLRMDLENNYNSGLYVGEWIRRLTLNEKITKEDIELFMRSGETAAKFRKWYDQYEQIYNEFYDEV